MNKKFILIITCSVVIVAIFVILNNVHWNGKSLQEQARALCMSTYTVTYSDATKHNSAEILDTLRKNLSKVDFSGDIVGSRPWWEYISIGEPNEEGVFTLSVPGASQDIGKIVKETLLRMEHISKVDDSVLSWCE